MGKNYVENSLKRFLKRKVKITLGFVVAFLITGTVGFGATGLSSGEIEKPYGEGEYYLKDDTVEITNTNTKDGVVFDSSMITLNGNQTLELVSNNSIGTLKNTTIIGEDKKTGEKIGTVILTNNNKIGTVILTNNNKIGKALYAGINEKIEISVDSLKIENNLGIDVQGGDIIFSANDLKIKSNMLGVRLQYGNFKVANSKEVNIIGNNDDGIFQTGGSCVISADKLNIQGFSNGIYLTNGTFEIKDSKDVTITGEEKNNAGIFQTGGSCVVSADKLNILGFSGINIREEGNFNIENSQDVTIIGEKKYGIEQVGGVSNISADNLKIVGSSAGVYAGYGKMTLSAKEKITIGNGTINENGEFIKGKTNAITVSSNAEFILNKDDDTIVEILGNIVTSSKLDLNLTNENSIIDGKIHTIGSKGISNIGLSNGAVWNNTDTSKVTNVTLNGGVITNSSTENDITIGSLGGNGGTLNLGAGVDEDGNVTSGKIEIGEITDKNSHFDIHYTGNANLEVDENNAEDIFGELAGNIIVNGDNKLNADATLEEGFVSDSYTSDLTVGKDGAVDVDNVQKAGKNSMVEGISDLATINLLTWRQEMNSLNKRMGELRNSTGEHGVWSRVYTGKIENGDRYDNDYQTYQVGYDKKYSVDNGVMFVGGLVSYSKGETNYELGEGENYSVGAGIYATWLNNDGYFADVVLKQSRLHNKFDITSKDLSKSQSGDYNNWGTSLSGQYGKRFDVSDKLFIEPSAELTLGRVEDTTYITSAGVNVHQDTMYSLVGNIGTAVGYKFNDKGNIYTRVSLVREFQGDIDTYYELNGAKNETHEDLADTWIEFGIGANYRFAEDLNIYVDLQKTGEATVDTEWQANVGFRYEF